MLSLISPQEQEYALSSLYTVRYRKKAYWESDQRILPLKQGNVCGGRGLTVEPLGQGHIFRPICGLRMVTKLYSQPIRKRRGRFF